MNNFSGARAYQAQKLRSERDLKVEKYAPLVKRIALHLKSRLPPSVELDDLIQAGMLGLMDAINHYQEGYGATFETYAGIRIRGSMIDEMRQLDWAPRSVHQNTRMISEAMAKLAHTLGREPKDTEIAKELNVDIDKYHQMLQDSTNTQVIGFDDLGVPEDVMSVQGVDSKEDSLYKSLANDKFKAALAKAISELPLREQQVLALYYDEELNLKEIGKVLDVSESRCCQIMSQAIIRLRSKLQMWS